MRRTPRTFGDETTVSDTRSFRSRTHRRSWPQHPWRWAVRRIVGVMMAPRPNVKVDRA